ncbi:MAG: L,D-transpeptidase [Paracoccaceae bacterium]
MGWDLVPLTQGLRRRRQDARGRLFHRPPQPRQRISPVDRHSHPNAARPGQCAGPGQKPRWRYLHPWAAAGVQQARARLTAGCIAVTNRQIEEIYAMVRNGTPITIRP